MRRIFLLVDHLNMYFGPELHWPLWINFLGRFVAPAFFHTRNKRRYLKRLLIGALVVGDR